MGAKKKVEPPQPPPPTAEKTNNVTLKIITSEGSQFKIQEQLFNKYAHKGKSLSDSAKDHTIKLPQIDSSTFKVISEYLELHKEKQPEKIIVPIRSNQSLDHIMQKEDAYLVRKVQQEGDSAILKVMDACLYLELESLRKRFACCIAIKLMGNTLQELKEKYELDEIDLDEETLRNGMKPQIEELKKIDMDQE